MPSVPSPLSRRTAALIRALMQDPGVRTDEASFVLEGAKPIGEVLRSRPDAIRYIISTPEWKWPVHTALPSIRWLTCPQSAIDRLTDTASPQPVLAVVKKPAWHPAQFLSKLEHVMVYGEGLQDPTNVGAILRSAAAFGVAAIWLSPGSVDPFNPKVVRASAGSIFHIPVFSNTTLDDLTTHQSVIYTADSDRTHGVSLSTIAARPPRLTLAFGSEGRGVSQRLHALATLRYFIRTREEVESLNVAASAAIALFHFSSLPLPKVQLERP